MKSVGARCWCTIYREEEKTERPKPLNGKVGIMKPIGSHAGHMRPITWNIRHNICLCAVGEIECFFLGCAPLPCPIGTLHNSTSTPGAATGPPDCARMVVTG